MNDLIRPRLFLITPPAVDAADFAPLLESALAGGDVSTVLITTAGYEPGDAQTVAETLVPIIQHHDVAALIANDTRITGRSGADGIHIDTGMEDLASAVERFQPNQIVGAGGFKDRHRAMLAGEAGADYVFFGRLDVEEKPDAYDRSLDLGVWWSDLFEPPCVVMAGSEIGSVDAVLETGADFIAVRAAVWDHVDGPASAVHLANRMIEAYCGAVA